MRVLKLAFISAVVFFVLLTAMSLFIPRHIRISKALNVSNSNDSIFQFINNADQWSKWHPAFQGRNVDFVLQQNNIRLTWNEKNDSLTRVTWQRGSSTPQVNTWQLHQFAAADSVTLQWYIDFHLQWYPWQKFGSLFYESTYGRLMEQGLQNLKNIAQRRDTTSAF